MPGKMEAQKSALLIIYYTALSPGILPSGVKIKINSMKIQVAMLVLYFEPWSFISII
jgi:hypothetical protein